MLRILVVSLLLLTIAASASGLSSYHIGNSLTWDHRPMWFDDQHDIGWHVRGGKSLAWIESNPTSTSKPLAPGYGRYAEALPAHAWDAVVMQTHQVNAEPVTILDEQLAFESIVYLTRSNPANADTKCYLLGTWARQVDQDTWEDPYNDSDTEGVWRSRAYHDALLARLRLNLGADVYLINSGDIIHTIGERIAAGTLDGFTDYSVFFNDPPIDDVHLSKGLGRYVAAVTQRAVLDGQMPEGFTIPLSDPDLPEGFTDLTAQQYDTLNTLIWEMVWCEPDTGVPYLPGDTDGDQDVDDADLAAAFSAYSGPGGIGNTRLDGDTDRDGDVDDADLAGAFAGYTGPTAHAIPEPASLILLGVGGLAVSRLLARGSSTDETTQPPNDSCGSAR